MKVTSFQARETAQTVCVDIQVNCGSTEQAHELLGMLLRWRPGVRSDEQVVAEVTRVLKTIEAPTATEPAKVEAPKPTKAPAGLAPLPPSPPVEVPPAPAKVEALPAAKPAASTLPDKIANAMMPRDVFVYLRDELGINKVAESVAWAKAHAAEVKCLADLGDDLAKRADKISKLLGMEE